MRAMWRVVPLNRLGQERDCGDQKPRVPHAVQADSCFLVLSCLCPKQSTQDRHRDVAMVTLPQCLILAHWVHHSRPMVPIHGMGYSDGDSGQPG